MSRIRTKSIESATVMVSDVMSYDATATGAVTHQLGPIPKGSFIDEIVAEIDTAWGTTASITVGGYDKASDATVLDGFMDSVQAAPATAGKKRMTVDWQPWSQGFSFEKGGNLSVTIDQGNSTAGSLRLYIYLSEFGIL